MTADPNAQTRGPGRLPGDEAREHLMVRVARMAHLQDMSLTQIAAETGLNRWQVSRLLQEARYLGILRIQIVPRSLRHPELEAQLTRAYGLRDAVVVPGPAEDAAEDSAEAVTQGAAQYLAGLRPAPAVLGVSWGRTLAGVAQWLPQGWAEGVAVVQINGTVAPVPGIGHQNDVAETIARKGRGRMIPLPVPAIVGARLTREVLEQDRIVADVLAHGRRAEAMMFSLGVAGEGSVLMRSGNILPEEMARLTQAGAVGDVLGRFIGRQGQVVDADLDARAIGLSFADLQACERVICVTAGRRKHAVTLATLRAGLINVLVTDEATATHVLEHRDDL